MDTVEITLPVTRSAARRLGLPGERVRFGALLSMAVEGLMSPAGVSEVLALRQMPPQERGARAAAALAEVQQTAVSAGLGTEEVEAELAAWKRERARPRGA